MSESARVQVLLPPAEAERFTAYCRRQGFKKSTLIARLVREYLEREDPGSPRARQTSSRPSGTMR
jgi:metal-responsive CopG/Arc/MetJ family transcriptional regulator